ncbi:energy transducer TonB [Mongoliitalea daihaiensis]|uniref:energy transducer TonB n=1 Tax=Mongoliitalea daihaiensis TaxID=2782006 RepID=UPI001F1BEAB8|nr:energy transducer TonB [Mongoliitalea daihaiensis]UJP65770.1 energy transducer TonB [Mongoliitalea daihaiensis]
MRNIFIFLVGILISFQSIGQTTIYLNEYRVPIQPNPTSPASFFMIKTGNELSELILTFTTDTVTVLQKRVDKNEQGIATKKIDTEYTNDGALTTRTTKDLLTSTTTIETYFTDGILKSKKVTKSGTLIEEQYYDQDGQVLPKPTLTMPLPKGDMQGWFEYLNKNMKMPNEVKYSGLNETVYVKFEIDTEGAIKNIQVYNPEEVHPSISKEAVRLLLKYPHRWKPGTSNGENAVMDMILPLRFKYGN